MAIARNLPKYEDDKRAERIITLVLTVTLIVLFGLVIWGSQARLNEYNDYMMSMYSQESK